MKKKKQTTLEQTDQEFKVKQRIIKEIEEIDIGAIDSQWIPFDLIKKWQKALKEFKTNSKK